MDELERFRLLPPDQQRAILAERLLSQVQHFGNREDALPEWREAAKVKSAEDLWRLWPSLPIVDKAMLRTRFDPREIQARCHVAGRINSTGGSTGEPLFFLHDHPMMRATLAASVYARLGMGWHPGMATVIVWGADRDVGKRSRLRSRLANRFSGDVLIPGYNLSENTVERVLASIRRHHPVAIYGFTSMLEHVAREVLKGDDAPPLGSVETAWNGGEMLFPQQVEVFKKAFGVPILNHYGGRELATMTCQFRPLGPLHVLRPWLFVEVVDDQGRAVGPGKSGRLLWTSTICRGTPFLRYAIGDLGSFDAFGQNESGIQDLCELQGRVASLLALPNGKIVNNIFWNHLFKEFPEVHQFQVVSRSDRGIQILLKGEGFAPLREAHLSKVLDTFLDGLSVNLSWVERIPLTSQGKLIQVVREPVAAGQPRDGHPR